MCTCQRNGELEVISEQTETLNESFKTTVPEVWFQLLDETGRAQPMQEKGRQEEKGML